MHNSRLTVDQATLFWIWENGTRWNSNEYEVNLQEAWKTSGEQCLVHGRGDCWCQTRLIREASVLWSHLYDVGSPWRIRRGTEFEVLSAKMTNNRNGNHWNEESLRKCAGLVDSKTCSPSFVTGHGFPNSREQVASNPAVPYFPDCKGRNLSYPYRNTMHSSYCRSSKFHNQLG